MAPFRPALRVLVVARRAPWPLNSGGRLRTYGILSGLSQQADVTLALLETPEERTWLPDSVRLVTKPESGARATAIRPAHRPASCERLLRRHYGHDEHVARWLHGVACPGDFDVTLFAGAGLGLYAGAVRTPLVWDAVDELVLADLREMQVTGWRRRISLGRQAVLHAFFERHVAQRSTVSVFSSSVDARYARRWVGRAALRRVSNPVDLTYFRARRDAGERGTLVFVGSLEFPPNVDGVVRFVRQVWPHLRAHGDAQRLFIVGRSPVPAVRQLAEVPGIHVVADVPDVRPYLERAAAVIVPTRMGGGVKNKILEGCAMERPVVASRRAVGGLSVQPGRELLVADAAGEWVRRLTRLLRDRNHARAVARRGRNWVERAHGPAVIAACWMHILCDAAERRRPAPPECFAIDEAAGRPASAQAPHTRPGRVPCETAESPREEALCL